MQLNELLAQVDALKAEIDRLRPLKPEVENRIMQKFRLDWNYHSNAIEGNRMTLGETRAFLTEEATASGKSWREHLDIKGHNAVVCFLPDFIRNQERLTEAAVREMHRKLLIEPYEVDVVTASAQPTKKVVRPGVYKTEPNGVQMKSGEIHLYAMPEDVPSKMSELLDWHTRQNESRELHPLVHAALFHHRFISIHPFGDGNGRMGRILMNLIFTHAGFPPVVIKTQDREPYVAALRKGDVGEMKSLVAFIGENLLDAEALYLRGARGESIEDAGDLDKEVMLLKAELRNAPKPIELTFEVQKELLGIRVLPLLNRVTAKLRQFDELFAKCSASIQYGIHNGTSSALSIRSSDLGREVLGLATNGHTLREVGIHFQWNGFLRDGTNDFSVYLELKMRFEERKWFFECRETKYEKRLLYQAWFSEDEIDQLVSDLGRNVLQQIKNHRIQPAG